MNEKTNAAFGAYEIIKNSANINLGIGTGSTTNAFIENNLNQIKDHINICLLYTSPSPRDRLLSRMPSSA